MKALPQVELRAILLLPKGLSDGVLLRIKVAVGRPLRLKLG
jgi:hypothetical protein